MRALLLILFFLPISSFSQSEVIKDTAIVNEILSKSKENVIDHIHDEVCMCIDSISSTIENKTKNKLISDCFKKHIMSYQLAEMLSSLNNNTSKKINLEIADEGSNKFNKIYRDLEKHAMSHCKSLVDLMAAQDNVTSDNSYSNNDLSNKFYNDGNKFLKKENYKEALPLYLKAVEIDSNYAFAWDNIGICYRRLGKYEQALDAYEHSLRIDSMGHIPLQNRPIVYEKMNMLDKAIESYRTISARYPDDPEAFFGAGRIGVIKKDYENALDDLCIAYNLYIKQKSPYKVDAETLISTIYHEMKKLNKEDVFNRILKENNLNPNK